MQTYQMPLRCTMQLAPMTNSVAGLFINDSEHFLKAKVLKKMTEAKQNLKRLASLYRKSRLCPPQRMLSTEERPHERFFVHSQVLTLRSHAALHKHSNHPLTLGTTITRIDKVRFGHFFNYTAKLHNKFPC